MQMTKAQPPEPENEIARKLFLLLASESSEEILPLCRQIADLEEEKQREYARLLKCPADVAAGLARLITLQQDLLLQLKEQRKQNEGYQKEETI